MISLFKKYTQNKKVLILGFGREGKSTLQFIQRYFPGLRVGIADQNNSLPEIVGDGVSLENLFFGKGYFDAIFDFDVIIKSPGIKLDERVKTIPNKLWLSQTGLFLEYYAKQIIGITGTKGKSTSSSLIHHILKNAGRKSFLVGNIGQPPFDLIPEIDSETNIVFELSANQLEFVEHSPHIAILLNLFPEHLDYFGTIGKYYESKMNIAKFQSPKDILIFDATNEDIIYQVDAVLVSSKKLPIPNLKGQEFNDEPFKFLGGILPEKLKLKGLHNLKNIAAASMACYFAGLKPEAIVASLETFQPLEHRLEFVGNYCGIDFYNDSISTIPESTLAAIKTIKNIHTLILGGFDRGIDYSALLLALPETTVERVIYTGAAGRRMMGEAQNMENGIQQFCFIQHFDDLQDLLLKTEKGRACVLSPAASSYDQFKNFEERGLAFKKMAESLRASCQ